MSDVEMMETALERTRDEKEVREDSVAVHIPSTSGSVSGGEAGESGEEEAKAAEPAPKPELVSFSQLFTFADGVDKLMMATALACGTLAGLGLPCFSLLFGEVVDSIYTDSAGDDIEKFSLYFAGLGVALFVVTSVQDSLLAMSSQRQMRRARRAYLFHVLRQDVAFFDEESPGSLLTRIKADTQLLQEGLGDKLGRLVMATAQFVGGFTIGFVVNWKLALVMLSVAPVCAFAGVLLASTLGAATKRSQTSYSKAGAVAEEVISSLRTVASFNGEGRSLKRFRTHIEDALAISVAGSRAVAIGVATMTGLIFGSYSLGMWWGSEQVADDLESGCTQDCTTGGVVLTVFWAILTGSSSLGEGKPAATGRIQFDDVTFRYPTRPDARVLAGFSLTVEPGQVVALVGASGCGKSTCVSLLERFYDPLEGAVRLDGEDLRELNVTWLREQLGLVQQEPVLFNTTIRENIGYGLRGGADADAVERAARQANAHSFIAAFPDGYDTVVGERGVQLSGGQKQRIAIARAIVKNPRILLLDEATSALDSESETLVQQALDSVMEGRTTIVIAHRLSTIRNADRIVVVSEGQVAEDGPHAELIEREDGLYAALVRAQEEGQEVPDLPDAVAGVVLAGAGGSESRSRAASGTGSASGAGGAAKQAAEEKPGDKDGEYPPVSLSHILGICKPQKRNIQLALLASFGIGAIMPAYALLISGVVNTFYESSPGKVRDEALTWSLGFLWFAMGAAFCYYVQIYNAGVVADHLTARLRLWSFGAMLKQDVAWFDSHSTGALTTRLATGPPATRALAGDAATRIASNGTTMALALTVAIGWAPWQMLLLMAALTPLNIVSGAWHIKTLKGWGRKSQFTVAEAGAVANELIMNIRCVASLGIEPLAVARYDAELVEPEQIGIREGALNGLMLGVSQLIMMGSYAAAFYVGGNLVLDGEMTGFEFMLSLMTMMLSAQGLGKSFAFAGDKEKATAAVGFIEALKQRQPPIASHSGEGERPKEGVEGAVEFAGVRFAYPERADVPVFKGLDLRVEPGETVALVGASGCGKSTCVSLLERFYDPQGGAVLLDGRDLRTLNVAWLRDQLGLVSQEPVLFNTTIRENIRYGLRGASDADVERAARQANAHEFIQSFPEGYHTEVGDRGVQLSGGQKQRIAIARAIVKDPKILLLDEATSALDTESERVVQEALDAVMEGRTTIVIAHRLSTIRNADKIVVVADGRVAEVGTHDTLVGKEGGLYRALLEASTS